MQNFPAFEWETEGSVATYDQPVLTFVSIITHSGSIVFGKD